MRIRLTILSLTLCAATAGAQAAKRPDPLFGVDKVKHFFMAGFVETLTFAGLEAAGANRSAARAGGIAAMATVSIGREIHDRRVKKQFSFRDLLWDGIGASAALLVINKTQR